MSRRRNPGSARGQATRQNAAIPAVVVGLLIVCCLGSLVVWLVNRQGSNQAAQTAVTDQRNAAVTIAYSPEKATLIKDLVGKFNAEKLRTPDGQPMRLDLVEMTPEEMVTRALAGGSSFQALTPDSSLWLDQLNRQWAESQAAAEPGAIQPTLAGEPVRYAVTPIVIAAWEDSARSLGWPEQPVGWTTLQTRAQQDKNFRWSHPSTAYASGLLATLAEFYAGAGVQRGLTAELAQDPKTLQFVGDVEKTVKYYGEGELAAIQRAAKEGPASLVALYPAEGTLWADHPLALLETPEVTPNQRRTFQAFREFLATPEIQKSVLQAGYRPADLSIPLDGPDSPLTAANGVNPAEPQTTLQLPSPDVVSVVRNAWAFTKRKTNVFLVADTSGSMDGDKLNNAQTALRAFLAQILSDQERVGLVEFNSDVVNVIELDTLANNRAVLTREVDNLEAGGNTALLDAVRTAYLRLQRQADPERINAIVAMTDGKENSSAVSLQELADEIRRGNRDLPVVIFAVAYGRDADLQVLQTLADASGGQVRAGTPETIRDLYKILSTYF
jgi:Ca-activated chloride channel homolog